MVEFMFEFYDVENSRFLLVQDLKAFGLDVVMPALFDEVNFINSHQCLIKIFDLLISLLVS